MGKGGNILNRFFFFQFQFSHTWPMNNIDDAASFKSKVHENCEPLKNALTWGRKKKKTGRRRKEWRRAEARQTRSGGEEGLAERRGDSAEPPPPKTRGIIGAPE